MTRVTALSGGVGGAKILLGFQRAMSPEDLTAVVNTGDDETIYGVHVSPDVDIVTYWLAGIADMSRGWGLNGDTFTVVDAIAELGGEAWFRLGDRDLATCMERTRRLAGGETLAEVTAAIAGALGVAVKILPMSNEPVRTRVVCSDGRELSFQDYFVKERCGPEVSELLFTGMAEAAAGPGVIDSLRSADLVVICPSNPLVSVGPILGLPGIRDALREHPKVAAVSPIIGGRALKGPASDMLISTGRTSSASAVAELYTDVCDVFVIDQADSEMKEDIEKLGMTVLSIPTVMSTPDDSEALARSILELA